MKQTAKTDIENFYWRRKDIHVEATKRGDLDNWIIEGLLGFDIDWFFQKYLAGRSIVPFGQWLAHELEGLEEKEDVKTYGDSPI